MSWAPPCIRVENSRGMYSSAGRIAYIEVFGTTNRVDNHAREQVEPAGTEWKGYEPRDTTRGYQPQGSQTSGAQAKLPFGGSS